MPGVAQVSASSATRSHRSAIQVDPAKLAASGLTLEEVRGTLVTASSNAAKGAIYTDKTGFTIAANDQITDAEQFNDVILAYRNGGADPCARRRPGRDGRDRAATSPAYPNNKPGILLSVNKQPGANVIDTVEQIKQQLPRLTANIPAGDGGRYHSRPHGHHPRLGA